MTTGAERRLRKLPTGLIVDVRWRKTRTEGGLPLVTSLNPADA